VGAKLAIFSTCQILHSAKKRPLHISRKRTLSEQFNGNLEPSMQITRRALTIGGLSLLSSSSFSSVSLAEFGELFGIREGLEERIARVMMA
jgi:hypothetical protein